MAYDFMQRALLAGLLVGCAAPSIGIFLVQRRLSLMGDGIGHVVFMGVAAGLLLGTSPIVTALLFASGGAAAIEMLRQRGKTSGDVALALIFYLGIAGGVLLLGLGNTSSIQLNAYLFGSVLTVNSMDLWIVGAVAVSTTVLTLSLRKHLFAVAYDEEIARVSGLPVTALNMLIAVVAATTVAVTAKVLGVLLVSALLVLPVAAIQQVTTSFRSTFYGSLLAGALLTTSGLVVAFYADLFPAATIVLMGIALFVITSAARTLLRVT
ncbi:MAG: metal ABC transporter permease [Actinomycetota bacterium]|nr:metal ABC transporter permease [Actinomycetota bacterium]